MMVMRISLSPFRIIHFLFLFLGLISTSLFSAPHSTGLDAFFLEAPGVFDDIPKSYQSEMKWFLPDSKLITTKPVIAIKGQNQYQSGTFINDTRLRLQGDGQFYHEFKFSKPGKQYLYVSFTTPANKVLVVRRKVLYLALPSDIDLYERNRQAYISFMNTDLVYNPRFKRKLSDPVTRADLAYFLSALLSDSRERSTLLISDVPSSHFAKSAIAWSVSSNILSLFPDRTFHPDVAVSKLDVIVALATAMKLPIQEVPDSFPYSDFSSQDPAAKYVYAALKSKFIPASGRLDGDQVLTFATFIDFVASLSVVKSELVALEDFSIGFSEDPTDLKRIFSPVVTELKSNIQKMGAMSKIVFDSPQPFSIVLNGSVLFSGRVVPFQHFLIEKQSVTPNLSGEFSQQIKVSPGRHDFNIDVFSSRFQFVVYALQGYPDLAGHWFSETAAKLRYIGFLPPNALFSPGDPMSRASVATYLAKVYSDSGPELNSHLLISDVPKDTLNRDSIQKMVDLGVFTLSSDHQFFPKQYMTRSEALIAIVRAVQRFEPLMSKTMNRAQFPFWDVPKDHPLREPLLKALSWGIVIPSHEFNPGRTINRAEFFSMLSKLTPLSKKLQFDRVSNDNVKPLDLDAPIEGSDFDDSKNSDQIFHSEPASDFDGIDDLINLDYDLKPKGKVK